MSIEEKMNAKLISNGEQVEIRDDSKVEIPVKLTREELTQLSRVNGFRGLAHVAGEWAMIFGTIYLCHRYWHPALYILAVAFIG